MKKGRLKPDFWFSDDLFVSIQMEDLSKDKGKCFSRKLVFVLTLFGSIFPAVFICLNRRNREKQDQRVGFNLLPEAFAQVANAADFRAARAQGDEEGEGEADDEVDQADGEDAANAEHECTKADVAADGCIAEIGGGEGDVADVQRQSEEVAEVAGHAQEHTEDEVADQRAVVFVDVGGEDAAGFGAHDFAQQGVEGQALAQVEVVGAVVEEACDNAGTEQPQACDGGIP